MNRDFLTTVRVPSSLTGLILMASPNRQIGTHDSVAFLSFDAPPSVDDGMNGECQSNYGLVGLFSQHDNG